MHMIRDLTIEYRKNPIGIDEKPRFSWKLESEKQDVVQTNYQIQVVSGGRLMWDSGRVKSDQSVLVPYKGAALKEMTVYQVQVSVWVIHFAFQFSSLIKPVSKFPVTCPSSP